MRGDPPIEVMLFAFGLVVGLAVGCAVGIWKNNEVWRAHLVKRGAAEWRADVNGEALFVLRRCQ